MSPPDTPTLSVVASSPEAAARLRRAAKDLLARMPLDLANKLARTCLVIGLDIQRTSGFAQGFGGDRDASRQLALERRRQGVTDLDELTIITIRVDHDGIERLLGHELGHVALGHTAINSGAAATLSDDKVTEQERAATRFAELYSAEWDE